MPLSDLRLPSAADLLDAWDRALPQPPSLRALALLGAACPDVRPAALAHLTIGQRDALLLILYEMLFGPQLVGLTSCPACGESVELSFQADEVRAVPWPGAQATESVQPLVVAGRTVNFRLPDTLDLLAAAGASDAASLRRALLARCVDASIEDLPETALSEIEARMGELDPQADVRLDLSCPRCGHGWQVIFDIVPFVLSRTEQWARRTLHEVHQLASAYGWREPDILSLSAQRRQAYLDLIGG
jgi:hypothetical protein